MSTSPGTPSIEVKGRKTGLTHRVSSMDDLQQLLRDGELDPGVFSFEGKPVEAYRPAWENVFPKPGPQVSPAWTGTYWAVLYRL
jgi:hypothetical protein